MLDADLFALYYRGGYTDDMKKLRLKKTRIAVQHGKLQNSKTAEKAKAFWKKMLNTFAAL